MSAVDIEALAADAICEKQVSIKVASESSKEDVGALSKNIIWRRRQDLRTLLGGVHLRQMII